MRALSLVAALAAASLAPAQSGVDPEAAKACVLPAIDELTVETVPWRPTFRDAALEADDRDRPILLWAMNGHPLGCT